MGEEKAVENDSDGEGVDFTRSKNLAMEEKFTVSLIMRTTSEYARVSATTRSLRNK